MALEENSGVIRGGPHRPDVCSIVALPGGGRFDRQITVDLHRSPPRARKRSCRPCAAALSDGVCCGWGCPHAGFFRSDLST